MKRKYTSILLILMALLVQVARPTASVAASPAPKVTEVNAVGDHGGVIVHDGDVIDVGLIGVRFFFDRAITCNSFTKAVHVTDSQGRAVVWAPDCAANDGYVRDTALRTTNRILPSGERYTITLKGGPDGLLTFDGTPMDHDWSISLNTLQRPFALKTIQHTGHSGNDKINISDGDQFPRDVYSFRLGFDRILDGGTLSAITVRDSQGRDPGWSHIWNLSYRPDEVELRPPALLPRGETYTILIKGGALKSSLGIVWANDLTFTLHADTNMYQTPQKASTPWGAYHKLAYAFYQMDLDAGEFTIEPVGPPERTHFRVIDESTNTTIFDQEGLFGNMTYARVNIPRRGRYQLVLSPAKVDSLIVTGMDLAMSGEVPLSVLSNPKQFEVENRPFTVLPEHLGTVPIDLVKIHLDGKVAAANVLQPDQTMTPTTIDTTNLSEGVHTLQVITKAHNSNNLGTSVYRFSVDRADSFTDVGTQHWAHHYVEVMHDLGILSGRAASLFVPDQPVTRAEFAKMLAFTLDIHPSNAGSNTFVDAADSWAQPYIQALAEKGYTTGEMVGGKRYFYPNRTITRAEAVTIIGRVVVAPNLIVHDDLPFADRHQVPDWAYSAVKALLETKSISGFPDGNFYPNGNLQRDQAARVIGNLIGL